MMSHSQGEKPMKRKTLFLLSILTISATLLSGCKSADSVDNSETIETTAIESEATEETEIITETVEEIETETTSEDDLGLGETPPYEVVDQGDYPDSRSDHQANWDIYKNYFDDFSAYGTDFAGKEFNDLPYCGDTGYDPKGTILQERTTDKGYTVLYDTNTGKVYYSSMILPTGDGYDEEKSSNALVQYILDNDIFSVYDLTYSQFQEILGVYNGD